MPNGLPKNDEAFGKVEIFYEGLNFDVPLLRENSGEQTLTLVASFQGCADRGVCYPPMTKEVTLIHQGVTTIQTNTLPPNRLVPAALYR